MDIANDARTVLTTVDDALFDGNRSLVLVGEQVMLLGPVATVIVKEAFGGATRDSLTVACVEQLGAPPGDPFDATQAVISELIEAKVLRTVV